MKLEFAHVHLQIRSTFWSSSTSFFQQVFYVILFLIILSFMLSTYISSSLTQLTFYNLFLRAILYKEFGLKSTLLLVVILKLLVSLNAMASNQNILSTIQGATKLMVQIYHELFTLSKNDFIKALHDLGSIHELRYVSDTIFATIRRRHNLSKAGHLINRSNSDNLKEKLIKDIHTLFAFGEGTVKSMPKSLLKQPDLANAETRSDVVCDLSQTYATKSELETVKQMVLDEISNLKNVVTPSSNITSMTISDSLPDPVSPSLVSSFPPAANAVNTSHSNLGFDSQSRSNSVKRSDTMLFASDSLLNRMSIKRMNVGNYRSVKLTKPRDSLDGTVNRVRNHLSKHCNTKANVVLLAGTNDLSRRQTTPRKLFDELIDSINELKKFENIKTLFLCKLPPRSDHAVINRKVSEYNDLLSQHFAEYESVIVTDTVPLERDLFYKDGLHLPDTGLTKLCGIILSNLFKKLAPHLRRRSRSTSRVDVSSGFNDVD